jgi:hypothetical protein
MMALRTALSAAGLLVIALVACHSAGPYGHAVSYEPLKDEAAAATEAQELDPVMVRRFPQRFRDKPLSVFGVVVERAAGPNGLIKVTLSQRRILKRNLCENMNDEDSCRVTVTDQEFAVLQALVRLGPDDEGGALPVMPGSLLRLVGTLDAAPAKEDGAPVLRAKYYRHFPPQTYRTDSFSGVMRQ